ncbi:GNAT family N-acetyltransferase, partial [Candidatus Poribacteria bacterium]|nr:GNAT family N-acetyltransferase [Candidatus Poribacteria bacterium]
MEIREHGVDDMRELAPLYNAQVAATPFCYPVSSDEFADGVTAWAHPELSGRMRDQTVFVAVERGQPIGFAHITMGRVLEEWSDDAQIDCGAIRFIAYPPGRRDVGQRLIDAAQRRLTDLGASRIHAYTKATAYRFYQLGFGMLSTGVGHVVGLLGMNGYTVRRGEYFLYRPDMDPTVPTPPDPSAKV